MKDYKIVKLCYNSNIVDELLDGLELPTVKAPRKKNAPTYYNIPCAFDTETTSTIINGDKFAFMYEWTFGLGDRVVIGRTWDEFIEMIDELTTRLELDEFKRLCIFVHNLSYDFQFFRKYFEFETVFCLDKRELLKAVTVNGLEFRCSYKLSGYSLEVLANNLHYYKVSKKSGDLDYDKIRTSKTQLTETEKGYCYADIQVVLAYISECIVDDGNITKIPLTKTGYVRNYCRQLCLYGDNPIYRKNTYYAYRHLMNELTLDPDEYKQLKRAFAGGFTHASALKVRCTWDDVGSIDFTSSYPSTFSEMFPMSKGTIINIRSKAMFEYYIKRYCCLFDVEITGLQDAFFYDHPISFSHCYNISGKYVLDNGRIVECEKFCATWTDVDYNVYKSCYTWESMKIANFRVYDRGHLPKNFISAMLKLYGDKTSLKGVKGKEIEYLKGKGYINSMYGMMVTDIARDVIEYHAENDDDCFSRTEPELGEVIEKYNNDRKRFLFYPWGVWVTAYARRNLWTGIKEFKNDYIYSDTDSIKALNMGKHMDYINKYNEICAKKWKRALDYYGLDKTLYKPKTIKGIEKPLGVWDYEETFKHFKTLGAKRYMIEDEDGVNITVSGLNKRVAAPYINELAIEQNKTPFDIFDDDLYIPVGKTGKNTHTYIDEERTAYITDYQGQTELINSKSSVHMTGADYSLSITEDYIKFIAGITAHNL